MGGGGGGGGGGHNQCQGLKVSTFLMSNCFDRYNCL